MNKRYETESLSKGSIQHELQTKNYTVASPSLSKASPTHTFSSAHTNKGDHRKRRK